MGGQAIVAVGRFAVVLLKIDRHLREPLMGHIGVQKVADGDIAICGGKANIPIVHGHGTGFSCRVNEGLLLVLFPGLLCLRLAFRPGGSKVEDVNTILAGDNGGVSRLSLSIKAPAVHLLGKLTGLYIVQRAAGGCGSLVLGFIVGHGAEVCFVPVPLGFCLGKELFRSHLAVLHGLPFLGRQEKLPDVHSLFAAVISSYRFLSVFIALSGLLLGGRFQVVGQFRKVHIGPIQKLCRSLQIFSGGSEGFQGHVLGIGIAAVLRQLLKGLGEVIQVCLVHGVGGIFSVLAVEEFGSRNVHDILRVLFRVRLVGLFQRQLRFLALLI